MSALSRLAALSVTRRNVLASFAGKMSTALLSLAFTPLFSRLLGIEAYGLIGFSVTLNAALNLLDMGFSATMNREMAQLTVPLAAADALPDRETAEAAPNRNRQVEVPLARAQEAWTLVRTLERLYWPICLLIAVGITALAPLLAHRWVQVQRLHPITVQHAIVLMGLSLALQWPFTLYEGGLMGLQRQVLLNGLSVFVAVLRNVVPLVILRWSPSIVTYFAWQLVVSAVMTGSAWWSLRRALPAALSAPRFDAAVLRRVWKFAAGMAGITTVNLLITQADKGVLSRVFPLATLGYYTLAIGAAGAIYYLVAPLNNALFPRFVQMFAARETEPLAALYHAGCQAMAVIILPVGLVMAVFAPEVMLLWTRDPNTAAHTAPLLGWLAGGFVCNGIMTLPFSLQTAAGWTRLTLIVSAVWAALIVPLLLLLTRSFGPEGAAMVWFAMNFSHLFTIVPQMHRRLLPGELRRWYLHDLATPALAAGLVVLGCRHLLPLAENRIVLSAELVLVWICAVSAAMLVSPQARSLGKRRAV
jgi:O-antigen/teichoic acid export membrane protein